MPLNGDAFKLKGLIFKSIGSKYPIRGNVFVRYEVHSVQDGLLSNITNITTTSYTHVGVTTIKDYFIVVVDNIGGNSSDTLQNVVLNLTNPGNGTATLSWNTPGMNISDPVSGFTHIFMSFDGNPPTLYDFCSFPESSFIEILFEFALRTFNIKFNTQAMAVHLLQTLRMNCSKTK